MQETEKEYPEVKKKKSLQCHKTQKREAEEEHGKMERNREKETALGLTISRSSVTLVSGFSGAAKPFQRGKQ